MSKRFDFILKKKVSLINLESFHNDFLIKNVKSNGLEKLSLEGNWNGLGLESSRLYWGAFNHSVHTKITMPKTHVTMFALLDSDGQVVFNGKPVDIGDMLMLGEDAECKITSTCSTKWIFFLIKRKDLIKLGDMEIAKHSQDVKLTQVIQKPLLYQINNLLKMLTVAKGTMGDNQYIEFLYRNISALTIYPIVKFYAIDGSDKKNQKQLVNDMQKYLDKYILPLDEDNYTTH